MIRRGTEKLPNQYLISKELENMYGASFNCGVDKMGDNVVLKFCIESISNEYALNNENILKMNLENLLDIVFNPVRENGKLKASFLEVEKENLKDVIESKIDDKDMHSFWHRPQPMQEVEQTLMAALPLSWLAQPTWTFLVLMLSSI